jgi:predicted transglutaminase-like cysteine proteinase
MKAVLCFCWGACITLFVFGFFEMAFGSPPATPPPNAPRLTDKQVKMAPIAFFRFCLFNKELCTNRSDQVILTLTPEVWFKLHLVNNEINRRIAPNAGKGAFDWSTTTTFGNCNDYAVQKQKALFALGFPLSSLSLTTAETAQGIGHLVVTVRTDRGDFVLDNLRSTIVAWNRTNYRWLARQSISDPRRWVSIAGEPPIPVAADARRVPLNYIHSGGLSNARRVVSELSRKQLYISSFGMRFDAGPKDLRSSTISIFGKRLCAEGACLIMSQYAA